MMWLRVLRPVVLWLWLLSAAGERRRVRATADVGVTGVAWTRLAVGGPRVARFFDAGAQLPDGQYVALGGCATPRGVCAGVRLTAHRAGCATPNTRCATSTCSTRARAIGPRCSAAAATARSVRRAATIRHLPPSLSLSLALSRTSPNVACHWFFLYVDCLFID